MNLPSELPEEPTDEFVQSLHRLLLETEIIEGELICPNCNRAYPIKDGIPNMLLKDDEL
jgi:multifunctional methyltransferase subunit TRM112